MTLRHMRIFIEVARNESISAAAKALHMTQPAVSRSIQEIEQYYGLLLFDRIGRRLPITPAGQEYLMRAQHLCASFDQMELSLLHWDSHGFIRLGASITLGNFFMPQLCRQLQKDFPDLQVHVQIAPYDTQTALLRAGRLDLAFIENRVSDSDLQKREFQTDALVLIVPPRHPLLEKKEVRLEDAARFPLLVREQGSAGRNVVESAFVQRGLPFSPLWESVSTQALVKAVSVGIGISILPEQLVANDIRSGSVSVLPLSDADFTRPNCIVWHRDKYLSPVLKKVIETACALGRTDS